ncbi:acidic mammalian chitinase-like [Octopus vulgaris]|uniref:Acidic mammalian chitinase-like n=1 Tax=Octopus vulgaris TaxID=6645 RepID=A0AA36AP04_OCTVU|nr:acidic mammalian chitinase-like [Octopus vulgaris]
MTSRYNTMIDFRTATAVTINFAHLFCRCPETLLGANQTVDTVTFRTAAVVVVVRKTFHVLLIITKVWSINFWLRQGMPRDRLIVGIATYGMSFTLANPAVNGIRAPAVRSNVSADRGGRPGPQTNEAGILSFYEICTYQKGPNPWRRIWLNDMKVPYAYGGDQWVGYDDLESITYKANYIVNNNLGGAFLWSVEMDDFNNVCGYGRYPLIMKIDEILKPWQWTPTVRPTLGPVTTANPVTLFPPSNTFDCSYRLDGIYYVSRDCRLL